MKHCGTQPLNSQRLLLRPFCKEDAAPMFRNWGSNPNVTRFLRWPTQQDVQTAETVINSWIEKYSEPDWYQWAIVPKDLNEPIGSISVVRYDDRTESMELGYCIGENWWKQGYTSEAMELVLAYLFQTVGANRVAARHDTENPGSGAVMAHAGMRYEGLQRQADWSNMGDHRDMVFRAILRSDPEAKRYLGE